MTNNFHSPLWNQPFPLMLCLSISLGVSYVASSDTSSGSMQPTNLIWNLCHLNLGVFFIFNHVYYIHHAIQIYLGIKISVIVISFCHYSGFGGGLFALLFACDYQVFISCCLLSCLTPIIFLSFIWLADTCDLHLWL